MMELIARIFDTSDFPARWHCGRWTPLHGWTHIASDLAIFGAYAAIPAVLFWDNTPVLVGFVLLFIVSYGLLYWRIATLRAPRMLRMSARPLAAPAVDPVAPVSPADDTYAAK